MILNQPKKHFSNPSRWQTRLLLKGGQVMLFLIILFMAISLIIILGVVSPTVRNIKVANDLFRSKQSLFLADSGVADVVYRVKNSLPVSSQEVLVLDGETVTTSILDTIDGKTITSIGNYFDYIRNIEVKVIKGTGESFFYGAQSGNGGFTMAGSSMVDGNIYSNGPISGGTVTGSAIAAGATGTISNITVGQSGVGDAYAHTVNDSTVAGTLKCQVGTNNKDSVNNNINCNTSFSDPSPVSMPITADQISTWKAEAETTLVINGDYSPTGPVSLGPVKITGNLNVKNTMNMTGTIWVQGTLSFSGGNAQIILATSTYGNKSGFIIVDKYTSFSGGSQIQSTGVTGSYVMLLVTSDCPVSSFCNGNSAITAKGNAGSVVLVAPYGTISFIGSANTKEVIGDTISLGGSTNINYDVGLTDLNFVSGPSGGYHVVSFRETQ